VSEQPAESGVEPVAVPEGKAPSSPASNQTAGSQAASNQTASSQAASNQTASSQAASSQAGNDQTGNDQTGKENVAKVWLRRVVVAVAVLIVAWAVYLILASFVPRWWALAIGRQVNSRLSTGILLGLIYGTVFTFLPLLVLAQAFRRSLGWKVKGGLIVAAILLAIPNLMTLSIVLGRSRAALAGDVIMDVQAPGFRYASLCGAIFGAVVGLAVIAVVLVFERRGDELKVLRARVDQLQTELDAARPPMRTLVAKSEDARPPSS
jgi:MFS family permease